MHLVRRGVRGRRACGRRARGGCTHTSVSAHSITRLSAPGAGAIMRSMPSACSARPRRSVAVFSAAFVTPAPCMRPASVWRSPTAASAASFTFPRRRSPMPCTVWNAPLVART
jgi:hypothetical protein